jgi:macrolide transport system ATP-binding/permease protein
MLTAMVQLHNVSYETPNRHLFHDVSFSINPGDRIGLVGLNGVGKTTLLSIVNGDIEQTSGSILSSRETIGIVPQDMSAWLDRTVYDFLEEATGVKQVREQLEERCRNLAVDSSEKSLFLYADALEKYNKFETSSFDTNIERALAQAGLARINGDYKIGDLSGGQRARIALAAIFAAKYDVILLDEPTNNLDQSGVAMLEEFVKSSPASFLIVSHDRRFLRNVTTQIIELTYGDKGIRQYSLGYDEYVEARKREKESIVHTYEQYEREKRRLRRVARDARIRANSASSSRHAIVIMRRLI